MGGQLYYNDRGRMLPDINEEVAAQSWLRKVVKVDNPDPQESQLTLLLYEYEGNDHPLHIRVNDHAFEIQPEGTLQGGYHWRYLMLPVGVAVQGLNTVQLQASNVPFNSWILAIDNGNFAGTSSKSFNQGRTWQSDRLGHHYGLRGEYVIRWFIRHDAESVDHPAYTRESGPYWVLQTPQAGQADPVAETEGLYRLTQDCTTDYEKAVKLCSWAADQWSHTLGRVYPPWHLPTILDWQRKRRGHSFNDVRGFCVHFAQVLMQACWSCGLYARGVILTSYKSASYQNGGHFVSEVYCRELSKWVMFDPDFDVQIHLDNEPLNVGEIQQHWANGTIRQMTVHRGPSFGRNPLGDDFLLTHLYDGGYEKFGLHLEQDYCSRPDHQMSNHGAIPYHEPDIVWFDASMAYAKIYPYVTDQLGAFYFDPTSESVP